jgi:hypothetical protein
MPLKVLIPDFRYRFDFSDSTCHTDCNLFPAPCKPAITQLDGIVCVADSYHLKIVALETHHDRLCMHWQSISRMGFARTLWSFIDS